ncbi:transposase family protein [Streptomyces sp. NPDC005728]|uniref:transposase family protein n=1 Tax=Streptomyces sp. NPDC005728 TaxID=3157054 RepID=UPI0033E22D0A
MSPKPAADPITLRIDGAETQVRRPRAHRPGRRAFVSGKKKQNTIKTTTISDGQGRLLWSAADRPGRMHDQTAMRTEGMAEQFRQGPQVRAEVDEGYRGLANESPAQVSDPPKKPKNNAPLGEQYAWREMCRRQPSPDLRRARQRRTAAVASATALHRPPRELRRDPLRDRLTGLGPLSPPTNPLPDEYRTGTCPADHLLINSQPASQPTRPGRHAQTPIADRAVTTRRGVGSVSRSAF